MLKLLSTLIEIFTEIGLTKEYLIILFPIIVMFSSLPYLEALSVSNVELVLSQKDYYKKRHTSVCIILFLLFAFVNFLFTLNITFLLCMGLLLSFGALFLIVRFITNKIHPVDWINNWGPDVEILVWIILIPIILTIVFYFLKKYQLSPEEMAIATEKKNIIMIGELIIDKETVLGYVIASVIETIVLILQMGGMTPTNTNVIVKNEYTSYFVYNKMDKDHLLCGNEYDMNNASNIVVISINDIFERKYSLSIYKKETEEITKTKNSFKSNKKETTNN